MRRCRNGASTRMGNCQHGEARGALAGSSDGGKAGGSAAVLASDRAWNLERAGGHPRGCFTSGRKPLVPRSWGHALNQPHSLACAAQHAPSGSSAAATWTSEWVSTPTTTRFVPYAILTSVIPRPRRLGNEVGASAAGGRTVLGRASCTGSDQVTFAPLIAPTRAPGHERRIIWKAMRLSLEESVRAREALGDIIPVARASHRRRIGPDRRAEAVPRTNRAARVGRRAGR